MRLNEQTPISGHLSLTTVEVEILQSFAIALSSEKALMLLGLPTGSLPPYLAPCKLTFSRAGGCYVLALAWEASASKTTEETGGDGAASTPTDTGS